MQTVRWSEEATTDLVDMIDYIEQRNPTAANNLHSAIVQSAENLPLMPYLFRPGRVPGTREQTWQYVNKKGALMNLSRSLGSAGI